MALEFTINLAGDFKGALMSANKELGETEKHGKKAKEGIELFEQELGKLHAGALSINFNAIKEGGSFFTFDLAEGAKLAFEAVHKVVEAVADLGKEIIKAAADAEDLNLAIKLDVGQEGAEKVDELAESFRNSRFSPKQIKEALLPILEESGNAHEGQWNDLVTAATDVATRRNTGVAGAKAALEALNDIELNPQRLRGSLKALGVKQLEFYKDLGGLLGISEKEAEKQTKAGKVKSETLLSVALNQVAQREGGALGQATNEGSRTLGASIARLANLKDSLFERLAGSEGMKAVQAAIDTFVDTVGGPLGTELLHEIDSGFKTLFGDLSGPEGAQKVREVVIEVIADVKAGMTWFKEAWPDIKSGAAGAWEVMKEIASVVGTIVDGWRQVIDLYKEVKSGRLTSDIATTLGVENSDVGSAGKVLNAGLNPLGAAFDALPKFASGGTVDGPTVALIGESGPEAVVPLDRAFGSMPPELGGGGGLAATNITYAPQFSFAGAGSDIRGQIESFEQQHRIESKRFFDEVRLAVGAGA